MFAPGGRFKTSPLTESDPKDKFTCRDYPELEDFLKTKAPFNQTQRFGRTFVLRGKLDGQRAILGYYSLVPYGLDQGALQRKRRYQNAPKVIPMALLGRLAVDDRARGKGHGSTLLMDALKRAYLHGAELGCHAVMVHAKDEKSAAFYERFGFEELPLKEPASRKTLFLKLDVIAQLVDEHKLWNRALRWLARINFFRRAPGTIRPEEKN
jgi:GNAT superfamily N-acetyltransferase